jgi:chaperone modulatory protein CbpM
VATRDDILTGELLDEGREYDVEAVCRICRTDRDVVIEMVSQGVVDPRGGRAQEWRFSGVAVRRAQIAARLQRELGVNLAGAALALDLLEELETLRRRLRRPG